MKFLHERQTRIFCLFLSGSLGLQIVLLGALSIFQVRSIQRFLAGRELAAVSYLLEQEIPPAAVAAAWNSTDVTEEAAKLLRMTGHTGQARGYFLLLSEQTSAAFFLPVLAVAAGTAAVILIGAALFFRRRERVYEEAEQVIAQYAEQRFETHLPAGQTGSLCRLFGSVEQLAQSLQAKSETERRAKIFLRDLISNISHQLKTPLAALSMYTEIMQEEPGNEETVRNFTRKSMQAVERMERLIQSLLKMARLDTGNIVFEKKRCPVSELVKQAAGDLLERAKREGKDIRIEGRMEETLFCDPEWTKEAVGNLVKNALDHTGEGGVIRICWERTPAVFRLTVQDNGCGIAEEELHHIFKQFYRSSASADRKGAGLGLSLARSIVEGQGGNLSVESSPGEGSAFRMTFLTEL
ncbi:MAG: HAMP domain-containing histidine kinase [Lachnospiraceae bacterium]